MAIFLANDDIKPLIDMSDVIDVLERAFVARAEGRLINRPRVRVPINGGSYNVMVAGWADAGVVGQKTYTATAKGAAFHIALYDASGNGFLALMEGLQISLLRTGAVSGVAARHLSPPDRPVAVIGAGRQAAAQVEGVTTALGVRAVTVFSRDPERRGAFADRIRDTLGLEVTVAATAEEAVDGAGTVVTITNSREPVLDRAWLAPGTHVIGAGNNTWLNAELGLDVIGAATTVVVDDIDQARIECGELMRAAEAGTFTWDRAVPLHDIVAGRVTPPEPGDTIRVSELQGIALADIAVAAEVLTRARQRGLGLTLS